MGQGGCPADVTPLLTTLCELRTLLVSTSIKIIMDMVQEYMPALAAMNVVASCFTPMSG